MNEYAVETFSLTKVFSDWWGRSKVCAVDCLDLKVRYNEVFGLLGPNGSGKTTTLKVLLGLLHPTKGRAVVLGGDATEPKISARIGFMPEESYLYKYLNARETLDFYGRLFKLPRRVRKTRIEALLDMVGLRAVANRAVGTYSKGMARRIGLAQALINDPDLLILDEPTTGLDPIGTRQIKDLIIELAKRGKTVLLCSHLLADVEDICDRIAILYGGKIQTEGDVRQLLEVTDKKQFTTGNISQDAVDKIKQIVQSENNDFELTSPMEKLETFFIKTIADARRRGLATSGVVSDETAKVGDFLEAVSEKSRRDKILDKLVSAEPVRLPKAQSTETEKTQPVESAKQADRQLLRELTERAVTVETTAVGGSDKDEQGKQKAPQDRTEQQPGSGILDELTGRSKQNKDGGENEKAGGDAGDE
jgi:ABC-2 type transport system ATP-binding protein